MTNLLEALEGAVAQGLVFAVLAIGVYLTYKILNIADLTVDGSICTGAAVCTMLMLSGVNPWIAMLCAIGAGILAGTLTGLLHVFLHIPAILAGILCQMILWSVNLKILGKANQALPARNFPVLLSQLHVPTAILFSAAVVAVLIGLLYLLFGTELGCSIRATGCNPVMSRAQGINTGFTTIVGLAISNGVVALCGALLCQYQGFADVNMGRGAVVIGLAAVVIGEAVLRRIAKNFAVKLAAVALGAVLYYVVYQTVIFLGLDPDLLKMFSAIVVTIFLGIPYVKERITVRNSIRKGGNSHA